METMNKESDTLREGISSTVNRINDISSNIYKMMADIVDLALLIEEGSYSLDNRVLLLGRSRLLEQVLNDIEKINDTIKDHNSSLSVVVYILNQAKLHNQSTGNEDA